MTCNPHPFAVKPLVFINENYNKIVLFPNETISTGMKGLILGRDASGK